jgi:hypothetical protein
MPSKYWNALLIAAHVVLLAPMAGCSGDEGSSPADASAPDAPAEGSSPVEASAPDSADRPNCVVQSTVCATLEELRLTFEFPDFEFPDAGDAGAPDAGDAVVCPSVKDFTSCAMIGCPRFPPGNAQGGACRQPVEDQPSVGGKCCYVVSDSLYCPGACG